MARRNRRTPEPEPIEPRLGGMRRAESHSDGEWIVQRITGSASTKVYRCPGCDMEIRPATPHIVAWPDYGTAEGSLDERRHWHTNCWEKRTKRPGKRL